jgi:K+-sensing histidine kinase KdpD
MNTPLNWIGVTNIIDRTEMGKENRELLGMVEKGFERLSDFVRAVLSYFEITSDLSLNMKSIFVKDVVTDLIDQHKNMIASAELDIVTRFNDDLVITADPEHFKELMTVLVENAIAFSEDGGTVAITSEMDCQEMRLVIADSGKGIQKENLRNVFKPFATEDCKRRKGGYGLNLPKAKLIADAHGWEIRAESKGKGHGAAFIIDLPPPAP